ncbi:CHAP domain-containing protein [Nocardioides sp. Kera G14]|uniref:CHAP domain-containing protein n=1 Tax=Nocardioides sp. Kera G14 TaxID=2884264 RepID=UPI001D12E3E1|nr:CHAP domain-containing protein [Nocardioides sp. Kera G14]UDY24473.1 CHAP domain-containing protein [Nocardioides sp. Kera G14]
MSRRALLGALVLALVPVLWSVSAQSGTRAATAVAASTTLCSGFDSCASKGMSHDGYKTAKGSMYWNMYSGVNCTNYVAYRMIRAGMPAARPAQLKPGLGNATYWGGSFGSLTNATPMVGAVAWWKANTNGVGSAGHVARVEAVLANGDIQISESNYGSEFTWRQLHKGGNRWPSGFIHLKDSAETATVAPSIAGTPTVGVALTAKVGTWSPAPTSYGYQWYAAGVAIPGATTATFTPAAAQLGKALQVRVTAAHAGYATAASSSAASAAVLPGTQVVTEDPTVIGTPQVDEPLTAEPGAYAPGAASVSVQWLADGTPIAGATGTRFVPGPAQANARISARVTAAKPGYKSLVRATAPTAPVLAPNIRVTAAAIQGTHQVGQVLTAGVTTTVPANVTKAYGWLRDGRPIAGASGSTYRLTAADVGTTISARVAISAHGFLPRTLTLAPVKGIVTPLTTTIRSDVQSARSVWIKVILTPPGGRKPSGRVDIKVGNELHHATMSKGVVRIHFTHPGVGVRPIKVLYRGDARFMRTKAAATVTVRGKKAVKKVAKKTTKKSSKKGHNGKK